MSTPEVYGACHAGPCPSRADGKCTGAYAKGGDEAHEAACK